MLTLLGVKQSFDVATEIEQGKARRSDEWLHPNSVIFSYLNRLPYLGDALGGNT